MTLTRQEPPDATLILTFYGIAQLYFALEISAPLFLDVLSIRDRGWQDLKYRVSDEEEGSLSFCCRNFTADIEGPTRVETRTE